MSAVPPNSDNKDQETSARMNPVLDYYLKISRGLALHSKHTAPVQDERFRSITKEDLDGTDLCEALVELYRSVFGDSDVWGEGAYCESEGRERKVDITEYERRVCNSEPLCECGARLIPFYPPEVLKERILREMTPSAGVDPVCILMIVDEKPVGFAWGAVLQIHHIRERLVHSRYCGREDLGEREARALTNKLLDRGLSLEDHLLYYDELAVNKRHRVGFDHLHFLVKGTFEHAVDRTSRALFWTSKDSPLYNVTLLCGFVPVHETVDGLSFLFLEELRPQLVLLQNITPTDAQQVYVEAAKLLNLSR